MTTLAISEKRHVITKFSTIFRKACLHYHTDVRNSVDLYRNDKNRELGYLTHLKNKYKLASGKYHHIQHLIKQQKSDNSHRSVQSQIQSYLTLEH